MMSKGANGVPEADLMYSKATTEGNGTLVKFVIDGGRRSYNINYNPSDYVKFKNEIVNQLKYFDDVYVEDFDIDNEYRILEKETFKYRVGNESREMHILLGKVIYPIDWTIIKRERINIPIGVKLEIGELVITPNRESIRYNDEVIEVINNKINAALDEIKSLDGESVYETIPALLIAKSQDDKSVRLTEDISLPIYEGNYGRDSKGNTIRYPFKISRPIYLPFKDTPLTLPKDPYFIFKVVGFIQNGNYTPIKEDKNQRSIPSYYKDVYKTAQNHRVYRTKDLKISKVKLAYIGDGVVVAKAKTSLATKLTALGLNKLKASTLSVLVKGEPVINKDYNKLKLFKLYRTVIAKELLANSTSYDDLIVPEELRQQWMRENSRARIYANNEQINCQDITLEHTSKELQKLSTLDKGLVIYGGNDDKSVLGAINSIVQRRITKGYGLTYTVNKKIPQRDRVYKSKLKILVLNKIDFSKMTADNHIHFEEFINKHKVLAEQATAYYIYKDYYSIKNNLDWADEYVPAIKHWRKKLTEFMSTTSVYNADSLLNNKFVRDLLQVAVDNNLLIKEYIDITYSLKKIQEDLSLLKVAAKEATTEEKKREVASYFIKKGYIVDNYYTFKPNEMELEWIKQWEQYADYTAEINASYNRMSYHVKTKYNLKPLKLWQVNFPNLSSSKSVSISMLSLGMNH